MEEKRALLSNTNYFSSYIHTYKHTQKGLTIQYMDKPEAFKASKPCEKTTFKLFCPKTVDEHTMLHLYFVYRGPEFDGI